MATATSKTGRIPTWLGAIAPLVLIGVLVFAYEGEDQHTDKYQRRYRAEPCRDAAGLGGRSGH